MCCWPLKYGLILANLIFTLGGLAFLGVDAALGLKLITFLELITTTEDNFAFIITIVGGAIIFLIAVLGCCGAIRENRILLILYSICLTVLTTVTSKEISKTLATLRKTRSTITRLLKDAFRKVHKRDQFNVMETTFKCCGVTGPDSYVGALPISCCPTSEDSCLSDNAFEGCNKLIADFLKLYDNIIIISVTIILVVGVITVALTFSFCRTIGSKRSRTV